MASWCPCITQWCPGLILIASRVVQLVNWLVVGKVGIHMQFRQGMERANGEPDIYIYIFGDLGKCLQLSIGHQKIDINSISSYLTIHLTSGKSREDVPEGNLPSALFLEGVFGSQNSTIHLSIYLWHWETHGRIFQKGTSRWYCHQYTFVLFYVEFILYLSKGAISSRG